MRPKKQERSLSDDLFRHRLDTMLDSRHALCRLAALIDWEGFDALCRLAALIDASTLGSGASTGNAAGRGSRPG